MKNITLKNNLKNIWGLLIFTIFMTSCTNAQSKFDNQDTQRSITRQDDIGRDNLEETDICDNINAIIRNDVKGKFSQDSIILFVSAKDKNEAFKQAQSFAIKLNAEPANIKSTIAIYTLPEGIGEIQIHEKSEDECIYTMLYLETSCKGHPLKEIRYVRLKCYNDL